MCRPSVLVALSALLLSSALLSPAAAQDFDNTDNPGLWDASIIRSADSDFGFGQVMSTNPENPFLVGMTFWGAQEGSGPLSFQAYVAELGPVEEYIYTPAAVVWSSPVITTISPLPERRLFDDPWAIQDYQELYIPVGFSLDPTRFYAAFLRQIDPDGTNKLRVANRWSLDNGVMDRTDSWATEANTLERGAFEDTHETAFRADFEPSVVPEPSTVILLGTGLMGLGVVLWRRREEAD